MTLRDKTCLITGAGSGIGRATAIRFAAAGASVHLVGRTAGKVERAAAEIQCAGGLARAYVVDVSDRGGVFAAVEAIQRIDGAVDVLVNNAGHSSPHRRLLTTTPDEIQSVLDSNLVGSIICAQAVVPAMLAQDAGTIINVSSIAGLNPGPLGGMIYSAVKAAIINFTEYLNEEFKETNLRASVVIPGEIATPLLDKRPVPPSVEARRSMVAAEDVAEAAALIASLPPNTSISELVIRPTRRRDYSDELTDVWQ